MNDSVLPQPRRLGSRWRVGLWVFCFVIVAGSVVDVLFRNGIVTLKAFPPRLPAEVEEALNAPEEMTLYSLEPDFDRQGAFHEFQILGKTKLDAPRGKVAADAFRAALVRRPDGSACFDPRHALRVTSHGHTYDLLLCYACGALEIYRDDGVLKWLAAEGSPAVLNGLLTEAQVPLARAFRPEGKGGE